MNLYITLETSTTQNNFENKVVVYLSSTFHVVKRT